MVEDVPLQKNLGGDANPLKSIDPDLRKRSKSAIFGPEVSNSGERNRVERSTFAVAAEIAQHTQNGPLSRVTRGLPK
jgi:hypothetical protein